MGVPMVLEVVGEAVVVEAVVVVAEVLAPAVPAVD
jgi:hypothetical protein